MSKEKLIYAEELHYNPNKLKTIKAAQNVLKRLDPECGAYTQVLLRITELGGAGFNNILIQALEKSTLLYEQQLFIKHNGKNVKASRSRQMIKRHGHKGALALWAENKEMTNGLKLLVKAGLEQFSAEQIVIDHADQFTPEQVANCKRKLAEALATNTEPRR